MSQFFVISAPSGTGKTTIARKILEKISGCRRSVSATTRSPRPGEQSGIDYHFVDEAAFRGMVERGELFEWEEVHGALYGTPRKNLREAEESRIDLLLDIDTRGALSVKQAFPQSCLIFLKPPSWEVLEERLKGRKTEAGESLKRRLEAARREMAEQNKFDYVIINDELEKTVAEVKGVMERERHKSRQ